MVMYSPDDMYALSLLPWTQSFAACRGHVVRVDGYVCELGCCVRLSPAPRTGRCSICSLVQTLKQKKKKFSSVIRGFIRLVGTTIADAEESIEFSKLNKWKC